MTLSATEAGSPRRSADTEKVIATAPGKVILFGEHAVVYGRPAIAAPVFQVRAQAMIEPVQSEHVVIHAPDIRREYSLSNASGDDPIATIVRLSCEQFGVVPKGFHLSVQSTIPVARGLGSGAAVSVAIARCVAGFYSRKLGKQDLAGLAFQVEKLHHGTPSGIDNTVIAFEELIYFVVGAPIQTFRVARPFLIAIADTGVPAPTKLAVGDVRQAWQNDRARYEALFDQVGAIADSGRAAMEEGRLDMIASLMNQNQHLLREMGVSSPQVENLVQAAVRGGARGAKLSGGGRGGNVIALVEEATQASVESALRDAGAVSVLITRIG